MVSDTAKWPDEAAMRRRVQFQNAAAQIALQLGEGLVVQILYHEFRPASLRQREDAGTVGLVDVALGRTLHAVQGKEGVGHRLHIVHGSGEQQVVCVQQPRHHLEIAAGLAVVVEGHQCQMLRSELPPSAPRRKCSPVSNTQTSSIAKPGRNVPPRTRFTALGGSLGPVLYDFLR